MFGIFDRFSRTKRAEDRARKNELAGDLARAAELFLEAERADEAARVLLLKADSEADPNRRLVLCAQAARVAPGTEAGEEAARRKAVLGYDLINATKGAPMHGELLRAAAELERVGEWERAAKAYALVGDTEAEIRVLRDAGAIERLEARLQETSVEARRERDRGELLQRIRDLDAIGERLEALRSAAEWLSVERDDQIQLARDRIESRLVAGPSVVLELRGEPTRFVFGPEVTIGRARADIVVASSSISRQHLRLFRRGDGPHVEDLDTRNGTMLAGARLRGPLAIGEGLDLELAGQVACRLTPCSSPDGVIVEIAGESHVAPLGPLSVGGWQVVDAHDGEARYIVLRTAAGAEPPHMGGYRLGHQIELSLGDEIRASRGGPIVLAVPDPSRPTLSLRRPP